MPRPSLENPINAFISNYAYLKQPTTDVVMDFKFILRHQLERFEKYLYQEDAERLWHKHDLLTNCHFELTHQNRLYLITDVDIPELVMFNLEPYLLEKIQQHCDDVGEYNWDPIHPKYIGTIFIFEDSSRPYAIDLPAKYCIELVRSFSSKNMLSNARISSRWRKNSRF